MGLGLGMGLRARVGVRVKVGVRVGFGVRVGVRVEVTGGARETRPVGRGAMVAPQLVLEARLPQ